MTKSTLAETNVLIVGAGTMGHGLAQCFAQAGCKVWLVARRQQSLDRARQLIEESLRTLASEGLVASDQIGPVLDRITCTTVLEEGARRADLVIESVPEDRAAKKDIFAQLDRLCPPHALLASNTTALNVFDFVETSRPDKVLICHWYTPPQLIPLVDVVKGPQTSQESIDFVVGMLKEMGKQPVVFNKFVSGYVVPRMQMALNREVFFLLDNDYISPEDLDEAVTSGLALRMVVLGLVRRMDFGGLDVTAKNLRDPYVQSQLAPSDYQPKKIFELVDQGHLGVKTSRGWFDYSDRSEAEYYRERDRKLIAVLKTYNELRKVSN